jgi:hypothetical protein
MFFGNLRNYPIRSVLVAVLLAMHARGCAFNLLSADVCFSTVNRTKMVWKAGELQRAAANMLRHKGRKSHVSNSVHALERIV